MDRRTARISSAIADANRSGRSPGFGGVEFGADPAAAPPFDRRGVTEVGEQRRSLRRGEGLEPLTGIQPEHTCARPVGGQHCLHGGDPLIAGDHGETEIGEELGSADVGPWTPVDSGSGQSPRSAVRDQAIHPAVGGRIGALSR